MPPRLEDTVGEKRRRLQISLVSGDILEMSSGSWGKSDLLPSGMKIAAITIRGVRCVFV